MASSKNMVLFLPSKCNCLNFQHNMFRNNTSVSLNRMPNTIQNQENFRLSGIMFKTHLISVLFFSKYSRNVSELIDLVQTLAR